jgi:hypothetical protein
LCATEATTKCFAITFTIASAQIAHSTNAKEGEPNVKKIAVYGTYVAKVPVRQSYHKWIYHRKGSEAGKKWYKRRVWKTTKRMKKMVMSGRYEFYGKGIDLYKAIMKALNVVPKGFIVVSAEIFLRDPMKYGYEGMWIDREVVSG